MEGKILLAPLFICTVIIFHLELMPFDTALHLSFTLPLSLSSLPSRTLEIISGNMLGDGGIGYPNFSRDKKASGNARYAMTMSARTKSYMLHLLEVVYTPYSLSGLIPFPNTALPQHSGKEVMQYYFATRSLPVFTDLHVL